LRNSRKKEITGHTAKKEGKKYFSASLEERFGGRQPKKKKVRGCDFTGTRVWKGPKQVNGKFQDNRKVGGGGGRIHLFERKLVTKVPTRWGGWERTGTSRVGLWEGSRGLVV